MIAPYAGLSEMTWGWDDQGVATGTFMSQGQVAAYRDYQQRVILLRLDARFLEPDDYPIPYAIISDRGDPVTDRALTLTIRKGEPGSTTIVARASPAQ